MLTNKTVVLGLTGAIAAYKAPEIIRKLIQHGARVKVVMTANARHFVTAQTLRSVSGHEVISEMFPENWGSDNVPHVALADEADLVLVAPASADIIGKLAQGIADDFLSTFLLSVRCPVILAPSMNERMFLHPAVQANLQVLQQRGCYILGPVYGELACGTKGLGRMVQPAAIIDFIENLIRAAADLAGLELLVTAGPTREYFDPMRFISNRSSGKMGYALAVQAQKRGAEVTLISGPTNLPVPAGVNLVKVSTAEQLDQQVKKRYDRSEMVLMAAAVADYAPPASAGQKAPKKKSLSLKLQSTPDILRSLGRRKGDRVLVGFCAETRDLVNKAKGKLLAKNLDLIVANYLDQPEGGGVESDYNAATLVWADGRQEELPRQPKEVLADKILDAARDIWLKRSGRCLQ